MGALGNFRDAVTIVNRTNEPLQVRYDGEDIVLQPGENPGFPKVAVPFAKKQNPVKGTLHPNGNLNTMIFKVGVLGTKDNCEQIPQEILDAADKKFELFDRSGEFHGEEMRKVKLMKKSPYSAYEAQAAEGAGFDINNNIQ